jgi:propanol-preferring alcohol dehydrogenase
MEETTPIIPKTCKAGVVCNPGPDFTVCCPMSTIDYSSHINITILDRSPRLASTRDRPRGSSDQTQCHRPLYVRRPFHDGRLGHATNVSSSASATRVKIFTPLRSQFGTKCAGHEGAGVIVKIGDRVKNLKIGQRAGLKPIQDVCHTCEYCKTGKETYCLNSVMTGLHIDGACAPFAILFEAV